PATAESAHKPSDTDGASRSGESQEIEPQKDSFDLKQFFTDLYEIQLHSFLSSRAPLWLPHSENPEISVILVLFNRAEMTLTCLRSLAENRSERMEIIIVDNASQDRTPLLLDQL